ncbi:ribonuclease HI [Corynebacterium freneyi]
MLIDLGGTWGRPFAISFAGGKRAFGFENASASLPARSMANTSVTPGEVVVAKPRCGGWFIDVGRGMRADALRHLLPGECASGIGCRHVTRVDNSFDVVRLGYPGARIRCGHQRKEIPMTTSIAPVPQSVHSATALRGPSPAMMRRRINPQLVPLRDADVTAMPRPTTGSGAEAVLATIHVASATTATAAIVCGELRISHPGLQDWVVTRLECDRHEHPSQPAAWATPEERQKLANDRYATLTRQAIAARARIAVELAGHLATVQAVHGRAVVDIPDATVAATVGTLPFGLERFSGHLGVVDGARRSIYRSVDGQLDGERERVEHIEAEEARTREPLRIATDASRGRRGAASIAWVTAEGRHATRMVDVSAIAEAEFLAIKAAIDDAVSREPGRKIIILSDSRKALGALSGKWLPQWATGKRLAQLNQTRAHIRDHDIQVKWVRGHAGDPLNELADRLAVHRRRCTDCRLADEVIVDREVRIIVDGFAGDSADTPAVAA